MARASRRVRDFAVPPDPAFVAPDWDSGFDFGQARAALPEGSTCTGMYIERVLQEADGLGVREDVCRAASLSHPRYTMFRSYPYAEFVSVLEHVTPRMKGQDGQVLPVRRALFELGLTFYPMLAATLAGRVVFGVLGRDTARVLSVGPKGWQMSINFGQVEAHKDSERRYIYRFRNMPAFLDTVTLGVFEGAIRMTGQRGSYRIARRDIGDMDIEITW